MFEGEGLVAQRREEFDDAGAVAAARPGRQNNIEAKGSPRRGPSVLGQPKQPRRGIPISDDFGPGWPEVPGKDQKAARLRTHAALCCFSEN